LRSRKLRWIAPTGDEKLIIVAEYRGIETVVFASLDHTPGAGDLHLSLSLFGWFRHQEGTQNNSGSERIRSFVKEAVFFGERDKTDLTTATTTTKAQQTSGEGLDVDILVNLEVTRRVSPWRMTGQIKEDEATAGSN